MALNVVELKQQRAKLVADMRALADGMIERSGETPEEKEKFEKMETDIRSLETIIGREEKLLELEKDLAKSEDTRSGANGYGKSNGVDKWDGVLYPKNGQRALAPAEFERRKVLAVQGWLMWDKPQLHDQITDEHRNAAKYFGFDLQHKEIALPIGKDYRATKRAFFQEQRAGLTLTASEGGYTVAEGFSNSLEVSMLAFGGMRQVSTVRRTSTGSDLPWPTMNDTTNKGVILNEATTIGASVDPAFSTVVFHAFKYSSKPILISSELLQDSAFDLAAEIGAALGTRIGRIQNDHFTTGTGTTLPLGVVVASGEGSVGAGYAVTADEVIALEHSVDPAYRTNARFMFHDAQLKALRLLKFSIGSDQVAYMWQPSLQAGNPDRLLGYPYTVNQSMTSVLTVNEKAILFGDFSKYVIRDVAEIRLRRLEELYAGTDQVGFIAFMRSDGNLLDAGTDPVKHFVTKKT
jgi:HK97 family phage major capsid protein